MELLRKPATRRAAVFCTAALVLAAVLVLLVGLVGPFSAAAAGADTEPWSFGVMSDTHWSCPTDPAEENPGACSLSIMKQMNKVFIAEGVEFVMHLGDMTNVNGDISALAQGAQELYDAGIGFFPARGNHDVFAESYCVPAMAANFPQTRGTSNTFGASNFSSPTIHEDLNGLSYSFDFGPEGNDARIVVIDDWAVPSQKVEYPEAPYYWFGYSMSEQQSWISERLDRETRGTAQAFAFSHHNLIGEYHYDCLFGLANTDLPAQNAFFASLAGNDVRYYFSGHEHFHNRSLVTSPDGRWTVQDIICAPAASKVLAPKDPGSANFFGQKYRHTPMAQELNDIGFYIVTVDGPCVSVTYYADATGGFQSDAKWPRGEGTQVTPQFDFVERDLGL